MAFQGNISSLNVILIKKIDDDLDDFRNIELSSLSGNRNKDSEISVNNICKSLFLGLFACMDSIMILINNSFVDYYSLTKNNKFGNIEKEIIERITDKELIDSWKTSNKYRNLRHHIAHENYEPITKRKNTNDIYELIKTNSSLEIRKSDYFQEIFFKDSQINVAIIDIFKSMAKKIVHEINNYNWFNSD